ncbi:MULTISPECIES: FecR family protein [Butyricimonas]|uniref:FecR family protein n=1 Tax=Butyricimonas TaxID=574697 RepID=UPI001D09299F|nr:MULTISPECIES: FecR family protein [Butyricimonas]MCB6972652.1 FecR domain-containing protein [Butyricimonas synergistica]MCG4519660.1 FecR domain-containing protein [Butyricimonas sp. DFI.6.44]
MGLSKKHFKIAEILAAIFMNTQTEEDRKRYELWEKENSCLAKDIFKRENYDEFEHVAGRFDRQEGWQVFEENRRTKVLPGEKQSSRVSRFKFVFRYAAVGIILIACGLFFWLNQSHEEEPKQPVFAYQIEAGTTGARLTLADGKTVDIVKDQTFMMKETDGTLIVTDSTGIDYVAHDVKDEEEIRNTISTLTGMEYTLTLSDGTKVYLNAESELSFPVSFKGGQRMVELSGEAYFEVAKDAKHPFVIKTRDLSVKVLGTSFNLRAYDDEKSVTTTLAEGKVQVFDGRQFEDIVPGEQVIYEKGAKTMVINKVDVGRYIAWREGKFIFRNERLEDIMSYLAKWYDVKYQFMDEEAKNIRIGAKLNRYDNMNPIIDMLQMNSSMSISLRDGVYYISSK